MNGQAAKISVDEFMANYSGGVGILPEEAPPVSEKMSVDEFMAGYKTGMLAEELAEKPIAGMSPTQEGQPLNVLGRGKEVVADFFRPSFAPEPTGPAGMEGMPESAIPAGMEMDIPGRRDAINTRLGQISAGATTDSIDNLQAQLEGITSQAVDGALPPDLYEQYTALRPQYEKAVDAYNAQVTEAQELGGELEDLEQQEYGTEMMRPISTVTGKPVPTFGERMPGGITEPGKFDFMDRAREVKEEGVVPFVPFVSGAKEVKDIAKVSAAAYKLKKGVATPEEKADLLEFVEKAGRDTTFGYKVLDTVAAMPAFMGEFLLTWGFYSAGQKVGTKAATKVLKNYMGKTGKKLLEKDLGKIGVAVAGGIAGGTLQAPIMGAPRIVSGTIERSMPKLKLSRDEEGQINAVIAGEGEDLLIAATKALGNEWAETVSEHSGGLFKMLNGSAKNIAIRAGLFSATMKVNPGMSPNKVNNLFSKMAYHGVINEIMEERVGEGLRAGLGLQEYKIPTAEQLAVELVAFSVPGVIQALGAKAFEKREAPPEVPLAAPSLSKTQRDLAKEVIREEMVRSSVWETVAGGEGVDVMSRVPAIPGRQIPLVPPGMPPPVGPPPTGPTPGMLPPGQQGFELVEPMPEVKLRPGPRPRRGPEYPEGAEYVAGRPAPEGFEIEYKPMLKTDGMPWKTEDGAVSALESGEDISHATHKVIAVEGGFGIVPLADKGAQVTRKAKPEEVKGKTLIAFVRAMGGIKDVTLPGEIRALSGKETGVVGLTTSRPEKGLGFDEMASAAVEHGWLPEGLEDEVGAFSELLRGDIFAQKEKKPRIERLADIEKETEREERWKEFERSEDEELEYFAKHPDKEIDADLDEWQREAVAEIRRRNEADSARKIEESVKREVEAKNSDLEGLKKDEGFPEYIEGWDEKDLLDEEALAELEAWRAGEEIPEKPVAEILPGVPEKEIEKPIAVEPEKPKPKPKPKTITAEMIRAELPEAVKHLPVGKLTHRDMQRAVKVLGIRYDEVYTTLEREEKPKITPRAKTDTEIRDEFYAEAAKKGQAAQAGSIIKGDIAQLDTDIELGRISPEDTLALMREAESKGLTSSFKIKQLEARISKKPKEPKIDARITKYLDLAEKYKTDSKKLATFEEALMGVAASQSLGRPFGEPMSETQRRVADQAKEAADKIAGMRRDIEVAPKIKEAWETSDLAEKPDIPNSYVAARKQLDGTYKFLFTGTKNEVFPGEKFRSAREARSFFVAQKIKAKEAAKKADSLSETKSRLLKNIKSEKGSSELINDLSRLGADAIKRGHKSFKAFSAEMKVVLGDAWAKVKHLMHRAYSDAKKKLAKPAWGISEPESPYDVQRTDTSSSGMNLFDDLEIERTYAQQINTEKDEAVYQVHRKVAELEKQLKKLSGTGKRKGIAGRGLSAQKTKYSEFRVRKLAMAMLYYREAQINPERAEEFEGWAVEELKMARGERKIRIKKQLATYRHSQNLTDEQRRFVDETMDQAFAEVSDEAIGAGIITRAKENYVRRIWDLLENRSGLAKYGFKTFTTAQLQRKFETIYDGFVRDMDLKVSGITSSYAEIAEEVAVIKANKNFIKASMDIGVLTTDSRKRGYIPLNASGFSAWARKAGAKIVTLPSEPGLLQIDTHGRKIFFAPPTLKYGAIRPGATRVSRYFPTKEMAEEWIEERDGPYRIDRVQQADVFEKVTLYAPERIGEMLNKMTRTSGGMFETPAMKGLLRFNAGIKGWILLSSFFHHMAGARSWGFGVNHAIADALKKGDIVQAVKHVATFANPIAAHKRGLRKIEANSAQLALLVRQGLTLGKMQDWDEALLREQRGMTETLIRSLGAEKVAGVMERGRIKREMFTNSLFRKFFAGLKAEAAVTELNHRIKRAIERGKTPNVDLLAEQVARLINADFGGLHLTRMGRNKDMQKMLRLLLLAPDWTESNFRTFTGMVPGANKTINRLIGDMPSPPGMEKVYRGFWGGVIIKATLTTIMAQAVADIWNEDDEDWREDEFFNNFRRLKWTGVNVTGIYRSLGVDVPENERRIFSVVGHFADPLKIMHPPKLIKGKGSPLVRITEALMSKSDWRERPYTSFGEWVATGKLKKKSRYEPKENFWEALPSIAADQILSMQPIQFGHLLRYWSGEEDGLSALLSSGGAHITTAYKPRKPKARKGRLRGGLSGGPPGGKLTGGLK